MSKSNSDTISITTFEIENSSESNSMFHSPNLSIFDKVGKKVSLISTDRLGEDLSDFVKVLGNIVEKLPDSCGNYSLDTLTFSLSVDSSGKISLIGELSAGLTSTISITLNKNKCLA